MSLTRYYSHHKHRPASFYSPKGGLWSEQTGLHILGENCTLADALGACDTPVLYLLPSSQGKYPKYDDYTSIAGCVVQKCLYKDGRRPCVATVNYGGNTITAYPLSTWYDVTPDMKLKDIIKGHRELQRILDNNFQPQKVHAGRSERFTVELLATPSQLGCDLLKRTLPYERTYEQLPSDIADLIIDHTTQGRIQTFYHGCDVLDNLHYYDGRWMYAACLRHVPTGHIEHDEVPELAYTAPSKTGSRGLIAGFYRVKVTIPDTWAHIGLLPLLIKGKPTYPQAAGAHFETWATSLEIGLALKYEWGIEVCERILWPETDSEPEPLRMWGDKLIRIRMEEAEQLPEPFRTMIRSASRNILLQTVGTFFRSAKERDYYTDSPDGIPEESTSELLLTDGTWKYTLTEKLSPLQQALCQPQFALWVWALARKKITEKALEVPFEKLVALRVDGVWTNCPMNFVDTGKVGQFTRKTIHTHKGLQWPKNTREMVKLVQEVR